MTSKSELIRVLMCLKVIAILVLMANACKSPDSRELMIQELIKVDIEFSKLSEEKGSNIAFLDYIANDCVLLRPNRAPVIGRVKIEEMFSKPDTSFSLTWEPLHADVAKSGDLGYTYGIFRVKMDSPEGKVVTKEGTYVSIWKKDSEGNWKFVLDTGNQGLGTASN